MDHKLKDKTYNISQCVADEYIQTLSKDILAEPYEISSSQPLYTIQQMYDMFRSGFNTSMTDLLKEAKVKSKGKMLSPYSIMRNLNVGDSFLFPYKYWDNVRSSAGQLKRRFGCIFSVNKLGDNKSKDMIEVKRNK